MDTNAHRASRMLANAQRMIERAEFALQRSTSDTTETENELASLRSMIGEHESALAQRPEKSKTPKD